MTRISKLSRSVEGQVVLITGAASGLGRATAYLFAEVLAEVTATIEKAGRTVRGWQLDVTDGDRVQQVVGEIAGAFGGIDIVINNAGISRHGAIDSEDYHQRWDQVLAVLLTSHTRIIRAALPHLRRSKSPRIVNIASTEGLGATSGNSPYAAAKHGVIGLTRSLAVELGKEGITVNCVCPGPIRTAMTAAIPEQDKQTYARRRTALRRYGDPEEVAQMTLSLSLPAASFATGVALQVDGGLTIRRG